MLDAVTIANDLVARDLIPPAVASEVTELATKEQKVVKLVECVLTVGVVELSREQYHGLVAVLVQHSW